MSVRTLQIPSPAGSRASTFDGDSAPLVSPTAAVEADCSPRTFEQATAGEHGSGAQAHRASGPPPVSRLRAEDGPSESEHSGDTSPSSRGHRPVYCPYAILGVARTAGKAELTAGRRRAARKHHPDNNPNDRMAHRRMCLVNQAYELLSDPHRRRMYDLARASSESPFVRDSVANHQARVDAVFRKYSTATGVNPVAPESPSASYAPVRDAASVVVSASSDEVIPEHTVLDEGMPPASGAAKRARDVTFGSPCVDACKAVASAPAIGAPAAKRARSTPVTKEFTCSIEELAIGCTKSLKLAKRSVSPLTGMVQTTDTVVQIPVAAGWRDGQRIAYCEAGNVVTPLTGADEAAEREAETRANIIFVLRQRAHPVFERDGNDLVMPCKISLQQALLGVSVGVRLLDAAGAHRTVTVKAEGVVQPGQQVIVANEGMPVAGSSERGNLRVIFTVAFPQKLSEEQRRAIAKLDGLQQH